MKTYEARIVKSDGNERPLVWEGIVQASRTAVAVKAAAENIPNTTKKGDWYHVSLRRV